MLFEHVAGPTGADGAPGVFCCGLRVVSMDGSVTDVPDSEKNAAFFGRPSNQSRDGAFPQARWVAAAESGTGSLLGAAIGRYTDAEQPLAADLLGCFGPGMLVLADRKFLSWSVARAFLATGAHILWRASASFTLKPVKVLPDGTYLAELKPPRKSDGPPVTVRVIEYTVHTAAEDGAEESSEVFCLVTSLLDVEEYPALDLACAYPLRWGCETVIGHHKTDMGEGQPVLRSGDPEGVMQEMWALFAVYQAICRIVGIAVNAAGIPPDKISFPHALAAATDTIAAFPPDQADLALATFLLKILMPGFFTRDRPDRASPRKTKSRRLPRPETRRAQRHQRHPANRVPPALSLADHLKARPFDPGARPALLRAYAICHPPLAGIKRMRVHGSRQTPDCGCLNPPSVTDCPAKCIHHGDPAPIGCKTVATTPGAAGLCPPRHQNIGPAAPPEQPRPRPSATRNRPRS